MRLPYYLPFKYCFALLRFFMRLITRGFSLERKPSMFGILLRTYVKRPEWLYYPGVELDPVKRFTFQPCTEPGADDLHLSERLIKAYKAACNEVSPTKFVAGPWQGIINKRYQGLLRAVSEGDASSLAKALSGMFQQTFLYGVSSAELGREPGYADFLRMKTSEELVALAESLGLVRAETPEQGVLGHALTEGLPALIQKVEKHLGISIDFPKIGGAYGLEIGGALVTPEAPEHIYVAGRIKEAIERHLPAGDRSIRVVEIGAGYGGSAYWLLKLLKRRIGNYTIIDLPMMNICQGYFLGKAVGLDAVQLYGEPALSSTLFQVLPPQAEARSNLQPFQLLINENSMPEMSEAVVKDYLTWAKTKLTGIFYSYNQEAFSPVDGTPQTLVPKAVAETGGYLRLTRNYSWVRRGYVEEIYSVGL
jgi:hypothetical protein